VDQRWRALLGPEEEPATVGKYALITRDRPILITDQRNAADTPPPPMDWPPSSLPIYTLDTISNEGWYGYGASGIDIFGRHSKNSNPADWYQWEPAPDPIPWWYSK